MRREADGALAEAGDFLEVGFFDGTGLVRESEGVWVGGDADGGDFEEFLLEVAAADRIFDF